MLAQIHVNNELALCNNRVFLQAPRDKLVCILNCCRVINNLLHVGHDGDARGATAVNCRCAQA